MLRMIPIDDGRSWAFGVRSEILNRNRTLDAGFVVTIIPRSAMPDAQRDGVARAQAAAPAAAWLMARSR